MNITKIKVTLELEGGAEIVSALGELLSWCDGRVVETEMPNDGRLADTDMPESPGPEKKASDAKAMAEAVVALANVPQEETADIPPAGKDARVQWAADKIKGIVAKAVRKCTDFDEFLDRCTQYHILWMYKALLGVPAAESSSSASGAMLALRMPDEDKSSVLKLMDIMHRAKY